MAIVARRLTSTGTMSISGEFDEITTSTIRLSTTTYYAALFDEVSMNGNSVAMRETSTGTLLVANGFNEVDKPV
jgi:hypothetical protein